MGQSNLLSKLTDIVGNTGILVGEALAGRSAGVWESGDLQALAIIRPKSTEEVSSILSACNEAGQSVVPLGGMTGLVGGHTTGPGDIGLSLERMREIQVLDPRSRTMTVQGGAILEDVQNRAAEEGLFFALDLGARASCTIGGNIATNAGGVRVIRYGMMRDLVLGLEIVLADGSVISSMLGFLKNNTGYDLRQLFVGAEGTLGVVTRAVLRLHEAPVSKETALLAVSSWDSVMALLRHFDSGISGDLVAYEVLWENFYELNTGEHSTVDDPLSRAAPYYVIVEVFVGNAEKGREDMERQLMQCIHRGDVVDGVMAKSENERQELWQIRESFEPEKKKHGFSLSYDVSLPLEQMQNYVEVVTGSLKSKYPNSTVYAYGHIGDGNLHFSIVDISRHEHHAVNDIIYGLLKDLNGSISAEHGIGLEKKDYLEFTRSSLEVSLMRQTKLMLDPKGILNPGKVFDI